MKKLSNISNRVLIAAISMQLLFLTIYYFDRIISSDVSIALNPYILNQAQEPLSLWFPALNKTFNSYFMWRAPLVVSYLKIPNFDLQKIYLTIFGVGTYLLFTLITNAKIIEVLGCLAFFILGCAFFGNDAVLLQSFQLLPWLVYFGVKSEESKSKLCGYIVVSILLTLSAWSFSPLVSSLGLIGIYAIQTNKVNLIKLLTLTLIAHLSLLIIEVPQPATNYGQAARVVADDGVAGHLRPLIGPVSEIPFVDRNYERLILEGPVSATLILVFIILLVNFKSASSNKRLSLSLAFLALSLCADILLPEYLSSVMPIASLKRIIPYLYFYPISPYILFFTGILCLVLLAKNFDKLINKGIFCAAFIVLFIFTKNEALFVKSNKLKLHQEYLKNFKEILNISEIRNASYSIINEFELQKTLVFKEVIQNVNFISPERHSLTFSSSGFNSKALRKELLDEQGHTRWYTTKQNGNEWLHVYFEKPQNLSAIALRTGNYGSDYPRSIRISAKTECQTKTVKDKTETLDYQLLANFNPWIGSLAFTPDSVPYLTPEGLVNIYFEKRQQIQCLLIEQTGTDNYYDWSIAEFKVSE